MSRYQFDTFFGPLVGTPGAVAEFDRRLTGYVHGDPEVVGAGQELPADPYERLRLGLEQVTEVAGYTPTGVKPGTLEASDIQKQIVTGGVDLIVNALRSAGTLYGMYARDDEGRPVSQRSENVRRSLGHVVGFATGLATRSLPAAAATLRGVHKGVDPNGLSNRVAAWLASMGGMPGKWGDDLTNAFKPETDGDGQVNLERRYRMAGKMSLWHCPAVDERTPGTPERRNGEPSLHKYLWVIAGVAMREIYPTQFSIVPDRVESPTGV